jgi:acylphosphatase
VTDPELQRLHAIIEGQVQGVGFRAFVQREAYNLKLTGWVRNRWDGSVEVTAEGEREKLDSLLAALYRGPRGSYVSGVTVDWGPALQEFNDFRVRMTN